MYVNGNGFELGEPDFRNSKKPLYALDRVVAQSQAPAWILEGEQKADALNKLGLVATTSGSATSASVVNWEPLRGRPAVIWADNDLPGKAYATEVANILLGLGCSVSCISVEQLSLPEGGDVIEWLEAHPGATLADVLALPTTAASAGLNGAHGHWAEPASLPNELPPVTAFDLALLPESLRGWVADIAERTQCPPEYPAIAAIGALGSALGRKIAIRPKLRDDWEELANLWGAVVGPPSVLKSAAFREVLRPLRLLEARALEAHQAELAAWRVNQEAAKVTREAARYNALQKAKKGSAFDASEWIAAESEEEPQVRRYIANSATIPALCDVLRANPNGILIYRDELAGLIRELDKEGMQGAREFYLSAYSGNEPYVEDRIGRGKNLRVDAVCLSLLGTIQPAVIGDLIHEAIAQNGGDGFLSRFSLLSWPDISGDWRDVDRWPDSEARRRAVETFERLAMLDVDAVRAEREEGRQPFLRFDEAARDLFSSWRADFERRLRTSDDHPALVAHFGKYRKLVPALTLIGHLADGGTGRATEHAVLRALAWAEHLESHARRAYASVQQARMAGARELLRRIRRGEVPNPFTLRDVYLKGWTRLSDAEKARAAASLLEDLDWLRSEPLQTGGRPKTLYWINPTGCP
jgi:hypothetical protein